MVEAEGLKHTPLYEEHKNLGARLVDFAGYEMPVQYSGIQAEHNAVRNHAGLFDVSHMGEAIFRGPDAERAVQRLVTRDVGRLDVGQAGYSAVCYEDGGTVDDVIVYRRADDFLVVVNASNREKDLEHFRENTGDLDVEVADESDDWALLALQGPEAAGHLQDLTETDLSGLKPFRFAWGEVDGASSIISRTGYTGEDGFEIYLSPDDAPRVWRRLIEVGVTPAGLGARDTLRLEAGMCLYGNELDAGTTPLEAGISLRGAPRQGGAVYRAEGALAGRHRGAAQEARRLRDGGTGDRTPRLPRDERGGDRRRGHERHQVSHSGQSDRACARGSRGG